MKKSDLENKMIVETNGGRFGVVVIKDATNENCIKFLYNPDLLLDNGYIFGNNNGFTIIPLECFDENLNYVLTDNIILWQIIRIYKPTLAWERKNLESTVNGLMGDIES